MNLNKSLEFFDPINTVKDSVHVIGLGAIGSHIAETLVRVGIPELHIYDFDTVGSENIANQLYFASDVGKTKIDATSENLLRINPDLKIIKHRDGWTSDEPLTGYIFICPDSITVRQNIVKFNKYNENIKAMFDFRMRLTDAQHYAADWSNKADIEQLWKTMDFTPEEAEAATPVSACGTTLSILPTIRTITAEGVANFINFVKGGKLKKTVLTDTFAFTLDAF